MSTSSSSSSPETARPSPTPSDRDLPRQVGSAVAGERGRKEEDQTDSMAGSGRCTKSEPTKSVRSPAGLASISVTVGHLDGDGSTGAYSRHSSPGDCRAKAGSTPTRRDQARSLDKKLDTEIRGICTPGAAPSKHNSDTLESGGMVRASYLTSASGSRRDSAEKGKEEIHNAGVARLGNNSDSNLQDKVEVLGKKTDILDRTGRASRSISGSSSSSGASEEDEEDEGRIQERANPLAGACVSWRGKFASCADFYSNLVMELLGMSVHMLHSVASCYLGDGEERRAGRGQSMAGDDTLERRVAGGHRIGEAQTGDSLHSSPVQRDSAAERQNGGKQEIRKEQDSEGVTERVRCREPSATSRRSDRGKKWETKEREDSEEEECLRRRDNRKREQDTEMRRRLADDVYEAIGLYRHLVLLKEQLSRSESNT